jgi:hypothetical protein
MDYLNKSINSSFKNIKPYTKGLEPEIAFNYNIQETFYKNYSERDTFQISNKFITPEEWDVIANLLVKSINYHTISISGINIDSYGLKKLAEILSVNKYIKTVKLEWNYLNEFNEEFDYVCEVIARGNNIVYLHLNNNKLNSLQTNSLSKIIKNNGVILQIDLRWNEIGNDGGKELSSALTSNNSIQELNLTGNKLSQEVMFELNEKLNRNKNFFYNLNFNKESNKVTKFPDYLQSNRNVSKFDNTYINYFREKDEEGKYFIEKEKEMTTEYKARYESQLINNANLEKKLKETEVILNNEKARFDDYKIQMTKELQNEKDLKMKYEEQILKKNEEFLKKEVEWKRIINELENKLSLLVQEKTDTINENFMLKEQMNRLKQAYDEKYKLLENQLENNNEFLTNNYNQLKVENDKNRKDFDEEIRRVNREWERKNKLLEEQLRSFKLNQEELEKNNSHLKKEFSELKLNKETEWKEKETRIYEEEV